jgi:hypothetical protein
MGRSGIAEAMEQTWRQAMCYNVAYTMATASPKAVRRPTETQSHCSLLATNGGTRPSRLAGLNRCSRGPTAMPCGTHAQTVRNIILHCPEMAELRPQLIEAAPSENLQKIPSHPQSERAAARLLLSSGLLAQFHLAHQIHLEGPSRHFLPELDDWREITRRKAVTPVQMADLA